MTSLNKLFLLSIPMLFKLITLASILAEGPPRMLAVDDHRKVHFAHLNQSITLKCPIEYSDFPTFIDWTKGNISLYMMPGYEITHKGTLKIKSVANQHAGTYTCEAVNGYGSLRVNLTLIVDNPETENRDHTLANSAHRVHTIPPSIRKPASTSIADEVGGQATFHCTASGQPPPHIFWLKDGHLIHDSILKGRGYSTLKLRGLHKSDAGVYKCIARNKVGEDEMDFSLYVTETSAPPRIIALEPTSITIREGATAVFMCEVDSKPGLQLHIKWLKRVYEKEMGKSIKMNDINLFRSGTTYYRPLNFTDSASTNGGMYKSKLLIRNSCKDDSGTYVCLALNDKGFNFKNVTLQVIGTISPLSSPYYFTASSTSLAVTVTVAFIAILAIIFVFHFICKSKTADKIKTERGSISALESANLKHNRVQHKGDFPEMCDPQSTSKLLTTDLTLNETQRKFPCRC